MAKETRPLEVLNTQTKQAFEETKEATERMKQYKSAGTQRHGHLF
jgi:hypothetical protein